MDAGSPGRAFSLLPQSSTNASWIITKISSRIKGFQEQSCVKDSREAAMLHFQLKGTNKHRDHF